MPAGCAGLDRLLTKESFVRSRPHQEQAMAKKTIRVSDLSGVEIPEGKGRWSGSASRARGKGVREVDLTDAEADKLGGRKTARRGRPAKAASQRSGSRRGRS
jgi:hypothetical protein